MVAFAAILFFVWAVLMHYGVFLGGFVHLALMLAIVLLLIKAIEHTHQARHRLSRRFEKLWMRVRRSEQRLEKVEYHVNHQVECVIEFETGYPIVREYARAIPVKKHGEFFVPGATHEVIWFRKENAPVCDYVEIFPDHTYATFEILKPTMTGGTAAEAPKEELTSVAVMPVGVVFQKEGKRKVTTKKK